MRRATVKTWVAMALAATTLGGCLHTHEVYLRGAFAEGLIDGAYVRTIPGRDDATTYTFMTSGSQINAYNHVDRQSAEIYAEPVGVETSEHIYLLVGGQAAPGSDAIARVQYAVARASRDYGVIEIFYGVLTEPGVCDALREAVGAFREGFIANEDGCLATTARGLVAAGAWAAREVEAGRFDASEVVVFTRQGGGEGG